MPFAIFFCVVCLSSSKNVLRLFSESGWYPILFILVTFHFSSEVVSGRLFVMGALCLFIFKLSSRICDTSVEDLCPK